MALLREMDPGEVGLADRTKPTERRPPRTVLFDAEGSRVDGVPLEGIAARLAEQTAFFYADLQAPTDAELDVLQREFGFHPLAIEDVRTRHQRPKIDIYGEQYFLVFYRVGPGGNGDWMLQEIDFFIGPNFLVATHDSALPLLDTVFDRFARGRDKKDCSSLLYEILDAIVDEYFEFLDDYGERSDAVEERVFGQKYDRENLHRLHELKTELALLRRIVAPERDAVNVLLRRDPPILDPARIFYFQDVYDHLIRISDSIDTYRDLATGVLDAFLSVQSNRLSETVRKLTVISTIFVPLMLVTSFFGMNFERLTGASDRVFYQTLVAMLVLELVMVLFLRWWGILGRRSRR